MSKPVYSFVFVSRNSKGAKVGSVPTRSRSRASPIEAARPQATAQAQTTKFLNCMTESPEVVSRSFSGCPSLADKPDHISGDHSGQGTSVRAQCRLFLSQPELRWFSLRIHAIKAREWPCYWRIWSTKGALRKRNQQAPLLLLPGARRECFWISFRQCRGCGCVLPAPLHWRG